MKFVRKKTEATLFCSTGCARCFWVQHLSKKAELSAARFKVILMGMAHANAFVSLWVSRISEKGPSFCFSIAPWNWNTIFVTLNTPACLSPFWKLKKKEENSHDFLPHFFLRLEATIHLFSTRKAVVFSSALLLFFWLSLSWGEKSLPSLTQL